MSILLQELGYVPCTHQPRRSLALHYVYVMIEGPRYVDGTLWFVLVVCNLEFSVKSMVRPKSISTSMVKIYIIGKEISI